MLIMKTSLVPNVKNRNIESKVIVEQIKKADNYLIYLLKVIFPIQLVSFIMSSIYRGLYWFAYYVSFL